MAAEKKHKNNDVSYISKNNKRYNIPKKQKLNIEELLYILIMPAIITIILSVLLINKSVSLNGQNVLVQYNEVGNIDYKVYLKENNYYNQKYLNKGMEYVASIISTVNPEFNYELHSTDNLDFEYKYRVVGNLIISKTDETIPLYTNKVTLLEEQTKKINANNFVIKENLIVDYDKYNSLVNSYKRDMGLSVDSKLVITMYIQATGKHENSNEKLNLSKDLQITIPLSEQTIKVDINTEEINNSGVLGTKVRFRIDNNITFLIGMLLLISGLLIITFAIYLYKTFKRKNIYTITLKKILNDYDRLIINSVIKGNGFDEKNYKKIVEVNSFTELVDAATNLNTNILFYEVIPGEKSYFLITNKEVLYKFKLTKGYLEQALLDGNKGY